MTSCLRMAREHMKRRTGRLLWITWRLQYRISWQKEMVWQDAIHNVMWIILVKQRPKTEVKRSCCRTWQRRRSARRHASGALSVSVARFISQFEDSLRMRIHFTISSIHISRLVCCKFAVFFLFSVPVLVLSFPHAPIYFQRKLPNTEAIKEDATG